MLNQAARRSCLLGGKRRGEGGSCANESRSAVLALVLLMFVKQLPITGSSPGSSEDPCSCTRSVASFATRCICPPRAAIVDPIEKAEKIGRAHTPEHVATSVVTLQDFKLTVHQTIFRTHRLVEDVDVRLTTTRPCERRSVASFMIHSVVDVSAKR